VSGLMFWKLFHPERQHPQMGADEGNGKGLGTSRPHPGPGSRWSEPGREFSEALARTCDLDVKEQAFRRGTAGIPKTVCTKRTELTKGGGLSSSRVSQVEWNNGGPPQKISSGPFSGLEEA
jgi:hypothetical protein